MEKVSSDENKRHSSRWIMALTSLVLIQTLGFVGVSVITVSSFTVHYVVCKISNVCKSVVKLVASLPRYVGTVRYLTTLFLDKRLGGSLAVSFVRK